MANVKIGSHPSHGYQVAEAITKAKQLDGSDSGKVTFPELAVVTYTTPSGLATTASDAVELAVMV